MGKITKVLVGLAIVALVAGAIGVAAVFAETPTPNPKANGNNQFVSKLAAALGIDQQKVQDAIKTAEKGIVDDAVKAGKITQQQGDQAKQRIDQGGFAVPGPGFFGGRGHAGPKAGGPMGPGGRMGPGMMLGLQNVLKAAATYLGYASPQALLTDPNNAGKSLHEIAQAKGKTDAGLKDAITQSATSLLDQALANKKITQAQRDAMNTKLQNSLDQIINKKLQGQPGRWGRGPFNGPNKPNNEKNQNQPKI